MPLSAWVSRSSPGKTFPTPTSSTSGAAWRSEGASVGWSVATLGSDGMGLPREGEQPACPGQSNEIRPVYAREHTATDRSWEIASQKRTLTGSGTRISTAHSFATDDPPNSLSFQRLRPWHVPCSLALARTNEPEKETTVNASTKSPSVEVTGIPFLTAAATANGRSSILTAPATPSISVLVVAAVLFAVLAPLNNSFACASPPPGDLRAFNRSHLNLQFPKPYH